MLAIHGFLMRALPVNGTLDAGKPKMTQTEHALLANLLDSFDRLFDGNCGVPDVRDLLHATAVALKGSDFERQVEQTRTELAAIVTSGAAPDIQNRAALAAIDPLRRRLADVLS